MQVTFYDFFLLWLLCTILEATWVITELYLLLRYQTTPHMINLSTLSTMQY